MSIALTIIDDKYSANAADGTKSLRFTVSLTNPYTTGGESITTSTYFPSKFLGGAVEMVNPSVAVANAGIARTGTMRGDTSSTSTAVLQFWNAGLSGTAAAGQFVDNTVANLSSTTFTLRMTGY